MRICNRCAESDCRGGPAEAASGDQRGMYASYRPEILNIMGEAQDGATLAGRPCACESDNKDRLSESLIELHPSFVAEIKTIAITKHIPKNTRKALKTLMKVTAKDRTHA